MLSDIENFDIMLGGDNLEREQSEINNSVRRPESPRHNTLVNHDVNSHSNSREDEIRGYAETVEISGFQGCKSEEAPSRKLKSNSRDDPRDLK